jgi:Amt family ammonium transporter
VLLEAGFARSRESVNILVEGIADTCICGVTFWLWGFAFMFEPGNGFIGLHGFALQGLPATYGTTGVALLAFWVFQFAFADTCSTITSGAMIGRCGFVGDLLYSVGVTGFIYPIIGHWAWGPDGWLATMGPIAFHDFAGSTVVHTIGGAISLAGAIALGPRLGRVFKRDGGGPMPAHDLIIGAAGGLILWFGWYGFNPWQHALRTGHPGNWACVLQHDARCVLGRTHRSLLLVRPHEEVGPRAVDQRIPRWPGGDHLSLLLG